MRTDQEHMDKASLGCPKCDSEDTDYGSLSVDDSRVWQTASCQDCEYTWDDVYTLTVFVGENNERS